MRVRKTVERSLLRFGQVIQLTELPQKLRLSSIAGMPHLGYLVMFGEAIRSDCCVIADCDQPTRHQQRNELNEEFLACPPLAGIVRPPTPTMPRAANVALQQAPPSQAWSHGARTLPQADLQRQDTAGTVEWLSQLLIRGRHVPPPAK